MGSAYLYSKKETIKNIFIYKKKIVSLFDKNSSALQ